MKTFQKGVFVEGAQKATLSERGENIDTTFEALREALKPFVLTADNATECFEKKPIFVEYNELIYSRHNIDVDGVIYYSSIYDDTSISLVVNTNGTFSSSATVLLTEGSEGTKLYEHRIQFTGGTPYNNIFVTSTDPTPFESVANSYLLITQALIVQHQGHLVYNIVFTGSSTITLYEIIGTTFATYVISDDNFVADTVTPL